MTVIGYARASQLNRTVLDVLRKCGREAIRH
jgi:hypothetical protein